SWSDCGSFLLSAAVTGQVTLKQHPREVTVQEGDEFTFSCSWERGSKSSYLMYWYRQSPGGSLKFIYREGDIYGEGLQEHFVGSVQSLSITLQL
ncbi:KVD20 protein, partial [Passerina amoena]|nr:KVD20 protein [Passerina amoena]